MFNTLTKKFSASKIHDFISAGILLCMIVLLSSCSTSRDLASNSSLYSDTTGANISSVDSLLAMSKGNAISNLNAAMITDVDVLDYYNTQAQTVFELYVEAQYQFRNMRFYNALSLLDRSIAIVPTIQAYLLQVMIYSRIGEAEKANQVYAQAEALNDAMGEDLLQPIELLTGVSARSNND